MLSLSRPFFSPLPGTDGDEEALALVMSNSFMDPDGFVRGLLHACLDETGSWKEPATGFCWVDFGP
jgi:hypothetical protein